MAARAGNDSRSLTIEVTSDTEMVMTRTFDAPRALVFKTMTDPELIPRWWGPRNHQTTVEKMDLRPGGEWRFRHTMSNGKWSAFHGVYREVMPSERLVYTFEWEGMPGEVTTESITFEERGGKTTTRNSVTFGSIRARDGHLKNGMEKGAAETMDRFAELLEEAVRQQ